MKLTTLTAITAAGFLPLVALAQTSPTPPAPPVPAVAPVAQPPGGPHGGDRDRGPKVPVTFLGVETSSVPTVVSEQLGLAKGFGLVVDYVVPDGPAATAGVQSNDILKMFNDQILTEPNQLSKLVRSNADGATVTLTVLRKGAETKLTVKLAKREVPQRRGWDGDWKHGAGMGAVDLHNMGEELKTMQDHIGGMNFSFNNDTAAQIREQTRSAREMAREIARSGADAGREGLRQAREAIRHAREMQITQRDNGAIRTTRIDMGKAQIVLHDGEGELKIESVDGKKVLTAKDPQGRLIFSGPVGTKEELEKAPAEVRQRYEKLEQNDLPNVVPPNIVSPTAESAADATADAADEAADVDVDANDDDDASAEAVRQVSDQGATSVEGRGFINSNVVI